MPPLFSSLIADRERRWRGFEPSVSDSSLVLASLCSPASTKRESVVTGGRQNLVDGALIRVVQ